MRFLLAFVISFVCFFATSSAHAYREFHYWSWGNYNRVIEPNDFLTYPRRPALLLLHGCRQNAADILDVSRLADWVDSHGFYLIIPEQHVSRNTDYCWNWFLPENQSTLYYGEPPFLRDLTTNLFPYHAIDPYQVYLVGMSAGASLAVNLFAMYPDSFAGLVTLAGAPFGVANDLPSAMDLITNGTALSGDELGKRMHQARPLNMKVERKILIAHGDADTRVNIKNGESLFGALKAHSDYLDDGKLNGSTKFKKTQKSTAGTTQTRATSSQILKGKFWSIEYLKIQGLGHQWPGSKSSSADADPYGPNLTEYLVNYLGI